MAVYFSTNRHGLIRVNCPKPARKRGHYTATVTIDTTDGVYRKGERLTGSVDKFLCAACKGIKQWQPADE